MPIIQNSVNLPDVLMSASGSPNVIQQSHGTVTVGYNKTALFNRNNTMQSQINGAEVGSPSGVIAKMTRRFNQVQYYSA